MTTKPPNDPFDDLIADGGLPEAQEAAAKWHGARADHQATPPICARCNRPHAEHIPVKRADCANLWALFCPALYHPLSVEAPPEAKNWTEPAPAVKEQP